MTTPCAAVSNAGATAGAKVSQGWDQAMWNKEDAQAYSGSQAGDGDPLHSPSTADVSGAATEADDEDCPSGETVCDIPSVYAGAAVGTSSFGVLSAPASIGTFDPTELAAAGLSGRIDTTYGTAGSPTFQFAMKGGIACQAFLVGVSTVKAGKRTGTVAKNTTICTENVIFQNVTISFIARDGSALPSKSFSDPRSYRPARADITVAGTKSDRLVKKIHVCVYALPSTGSGGAYRYPFCGDGLASHR
jgi:hypothetical protein